MIGYFSRHPTAANLLMIVLLFLGLTALPKLKRETLPEISSSQVMSTVAYPGASATEVEQAIVQRIEDAVEGIEFIKETTAESREGLGTVTLEMSTAGDLSDFRGDIQAAVDSIEDLPDEAEQPVIAEVGVTDKVLSIIVSADANARDLYQHTKALQQRLLAVPQVTLVDLDGISEPIVSVDVRRDALYRFGMTVSDVAAAIRSQNISVPVGKVTSGNQDLLLRFSDQSESIHDLRSVIVIAAQSGREVRLGDVASIHFDFNDETRQTYVGDRRACKLIVRKSKQDDVVRVSNAVRDFVEDERERYPAVELTLNGDDSQLVRDRLELLVKNGLQGVLLVFVTLWLFFNWKLSFSVAASLPVSFLGALFLFPLLGLSLNMFTLLAMLLALGLLMDDGIVIAENIASKREAGLPAMESAMQGVLGVAAGVFSSFVTTVCVLGPLAFLSGRIGEVLCVIPIVLVLVLVISLIEAFFILPSHLGHALADGSKPSRLRRAVEASLTFVRDQLLGRLVDRTFRWRYLTLGIAGGMLIGSVGLLASGTLRFLPFPPIEGDVVLARVVLPAGSSLKRTQEITSKMLASLREAEAELMDQNGEPDKLVQSTIVEYGVNTEAFESGSHVATMTVELLSLEQRSTRIDELVALWNEKIGSLPDVDWIAIGAEAFGPAGRPIEVRIAGDRLDDLEAVSTQTRNWFQQFDGTRNVNHDLRKGKTEVQLQLVPGATGLGLTTSSVSEQTRAAFEGVDIGETFIDNEPINIQIRMSPDDVNSRRDVDALPITLPTGKQLLLSAVARRAAFQDWSRIARINRQRTATVRGDVDPRVASGSQLVQRFQTEYAAKLEQQFPGVRFVFAGETQEARKTALSLLTAASIGLVGVYVLLSFQFRNYFEPFVVMTAIPLALIGVLWGHWLMGIEMTMPSALGFISLAGIVVNDSILLVLFLKEAIASGQEVPKAVCAASRARFRAIVLTSLTTIAGLLPLLFETDVQAQILIPVAASVGFGIMASTPLVLLVVPCLYGVVDDLGVSQASGRTAYDTGSSQ